MKTMRISRADYERQKGNARKLIDLGIKNGWVVVVDSGLVAAPSQAPSAPKPAAVVGSNRLITGHWLAHEKNDPSRPFKGMSPKVSDAQWATGLDWTVRAGYNHIVVCMAMQGDTTLGTFVVRPETDGGRAARRLALATARGLGVTLMLTSDDAKAGSVCPINDQAWVRGICRAYGQYTRPSGSVVVGIEPLEYVRQATIDATLRTIQAEGYRAAYHCGSIDELRTAGKLADCWFAQFGFGLTPAALAAKVKTVLGWAGGRQVIAAEYAIGEKGAAALGDAALAAGAAGALNGCTHCKWSNQRGA